MELRLKEYGTIEITNATLVDGGDILIETTDGFRWAEEITSYEVDSAYLTESEYGCGLVILLKIQEESWDTEDFIAYQIENPDIVHKLKAFL